MNWDIRWIWKLDCWEISKTTRFNNGNPYCSYRFGPLFIRRFVR